MLQTHSCLAVVPVASLLLCGGCLESQAPMSDGKPLDVWLLKLKSTNETDRNRACDALIDIGHLASEPLAEILLQECPADPADDSTLRILHLLSQIGPEPRAQRYLRTRLNSRDRRTRALAGAALGAMGGEEGIALVLIEISLSVILAENGMADYDDPGIAVGNGLMIRCIGLSEDGPTTVVEVWRRKYARQPMPNSGQDDIYSLLGLKTISDDVVLAVLRELGERSLEPAATLLQDHHVELRRLAVGAIALVGIEKPAQWKACEDLITALDDGDVGVRQVAASALTHITGMDFGEDRGAWKTWWKAQVRPEGGEE